MTTKLTLAKYLYDHVIETEKHQRGLNVKVGVSLIDYLEYRANNLLHHQ